MSKDILSKINITGFHGIGEVTSPNGFHEVVKNRAVSGLSFKFSGQTTYHQNGNEIISNENDVVFLPQGADYSFDIDRAGVCYVINFYTAEPVSNIFSMKFKNNKIKIQNLIKEICDSWFKNESYKEVKIISYIYQIIHLILTDSETKTHSDRFELINEYIEKHLSENITNNELANLVNINPVYLLMLFKKEKCMSPHQYVLNTKMEYAKSYLAYTTKQIQNIALELGFADLYSFSKSFKKTFNISPREFRKKSLMS